MNNQCWIFMNGQRLQPACSARDFAKNDAKCRDTRNVTPSIVAKRLVPLPESPGNLGWNPYVRF
jgi:hypothetical protein